MSHSLRQFSGFCHEAASMLCTNYPRVYHACFQVLAAAITVGNVTLADDLSPISAALVYDRVIARENGNGVRE
jgi:hypothetical protein